MAPAISMVMFKDDAPIKLPALEQAFGEYFPSDMPVGEITREDSVVSLRVGETDVFLAKMPVPIPWSDLEGPCATSLLWKNAAAEVQKHAIHWIVTINGELDPVESSTLLTRATASLMAACSSAIGAYWCNATLVVPKNIFIDFTKKVLPHGPPLHIWVDFRVGKDSPGTSSGFTAGMKALGHMEFESEKSPEPPGELRERLLALAGYVVENGPVIKDGDTVGEDADERIRVIHARSTFGHEEQVMRLVYESASPQKPWWKLW